MVHNYMAVIHVHAGSYFVVWEVVGVVVVGEVVLVVDHLVRGVGSSRGDFVTEAVSGLIPACLCDDAVCCQLVAGEGE